MKHDGRQFLSLPMRKLLLVLLREGEVVRVGGRSGAIFRSPSGETFQLVTVVASAERFLTKIVIDGRRKPVRETLSFTETGALVAQALDAIEKEAPIAPDDFEDAKEVYGDDEAEGAL